MKRILIIALLFPLLSFSQKQNFESDYTHPIDSRNSQSSFQTIKLGSANPADVEQYLRQNYTNVNYELRDVSLKLLNTIESQGGIHLQYLQLYKNIPLYRAQIKVNMDKTGNIKSVFDNTFNVKNIISEDFPDTVLAKARIDNSVSTYKIEKNYFFNGHHLLPLLRTEVSKINGAFYELFIDKNGSIAYQHDLNSYYRPKAMVDSIIQAYVFLPDPLTTAGVTYGAPYIDNNNGDVTELNAQRTIVNLKVDFTNDTFRLKSPYAIIADLSSPSVSPVFSKTTPDFLFTRSESGFEDVNAFYHITTFQEYVQSLGFNNLANYPILIDTHANNGDDNSLFNPGSPSKLQFGDGGVDDAEDADVIIHEYTHALSYAAAQGTNNGTERQTIDEANGDYISSSYSRSINPYKWENVFAWDGHNEFWDGRFSVSTKHYPGDLQHHIYKDAEIWSATLMEIWSDIGREAADKILLESMYGYAVGMTMPEASELYIKADSALYNGSHYNQICSRFSNRGISSCIVGIDEFNKSDKWVLLLNSQNFGLNEAKIQFGKSLSASVALRDVTGKLVFYDYFSGNTDYTINGSHLPKGLYILSVQSGSKTANFKLVKF